MGQTQHRRGTEKDRSGSNESPSKTPEERSFHSNTPTGSLVFMARMKVVKKDEFTVQGAAKEMGLLGRRQVYREIKANRLRIKRRDTTNSAIKISLKAIREWKRTYKVVTG